MPAAVPTRTQVEAQQSLPRASNLLELARSRSPDDRQRLLLGVASLCDSIEPNDRSSDILNDIFVTLAFQAERDVRLVLAERLASAAWAPSALIHMLALDEIEIARPVIMSSPLLEDTDLMRIFVEATLEHQIAVARRPNLSAPVADKIIDRGEAVTLTALASNRTAQVGETAMERMVAQAQKMAGLRAPLVRHPRLSEALAAQLYQWVGESLRQSICERFRIDEAQLSTAIRDAATTAAFNSPRNIEPRITVDAERLEMERRLVEKLRTAGQLRPGLLIRALRERRLGLFETALASLGNFPLGQVRAAIHADTAEPLYLACIAVGVDRAVFGSLLVNLRSLTHGLPGEGAWNPTTITNENAARAFRQMMDASKAI